MYHILSKPEDIELNHFGGNFRLVKDIAAKAAINFGYFSMSKTHPKDSYPVGYVAVNGNTQVSPNKDCVHFHGVYKKNGKVFIGDTIPKDSDWGITAGPRLLEDGILCERSLSDSRWPNGGVSITASKPRVAIGVNKDGNVILAYWDSIDMRQAARDMMALGCVDALAGDGGGSASWYDQRHPEQTVSQRMVPNCIVSENIISEGGGSNMIVCIDPGHGGADPGAVSQTGVKESVINLIVAKRLAVYLERAGMSPLVTRNADIEVSLSERANLANSKKANIFVSIHSNAADSKDASGFEIFHYPGSINGQRLAYYVASSFTVVSGTTPRRIEGANFQVLRQTNMPAILVELGFLTNKGDLALLQEPCYLDKLAFAIASGILNFLDCF